MNGAINLAEYFKMLHSIGELEEVRFTEKTVTARYKVAIGVVSDVISVTVNKAKRAVSIKLMKPTGGLRNKNETLVHTPVWDIKENHQFDLVTVNKDYQRVVEYLKFITTKHNLPIKPQQNGVDINFNLSLIGFIDQYAHLTGSKYEYSCKPMIRKQNDMVVHVTFSDKTTIKTVNKTKQSELILTRELKAPYTGIQDLHDKIVGILDVKLRDRNKTN